MSAHEVKLKFDSDGVTARAFIVVRDPLWAKGELLAITPECVIPSELEYWAEHTKREIDKVVAEARKKFAKLQAERGATR